MLGKIDLTERLEMIWLIKYLIIELKKIDLTQIIQKREFR